MTEQEKLEHAGHLRDQQRDSEAIWSLEERQEFDRLEAEAIRLSEEGYGPTEEDLAYMQEELDRLSDFLK